MNINRNNYEIYFIDYQDGNLSSAQIDELKLFLNLNPDLDDEFQVLAPVHLEAKHIEFPNKEDLLKKNFILNNATHLENLSIAFLENDLSNKEKEELQYQILNKENKIEFESFQNLKLKEDTKLQFPNKKSLIKRNKKTLVLRLFYATSAAAAIFLFVFSFQYFNTPQQTKIVASVSKTNSTNIPKSKNKVITTESKSLTQNSIETKICDFHIPPTVNETVVDRQATDGRAMQMFQALKIMDEKAFTVFYF